MTEDKEIQIHRLNWQEEKESAMLFRIIADMEKNKERKEIYTKLARIEEDHAKLWADELRRKNVSIQFQPRLRARIYVFLLKVFGSSVIVEILERNKKAKIRRYFNQLDAQEEKNIQHDIRKLFSIEKSHMNVLRYLSEKSSGPLKEGDWHQEGSGIRDIIFGMNDGLLSTFSLVAGVAGGSAPRGVVLLAGLAGVCAGAISMAAGAYVATKAEREVMEQQLAIERKELECVPQDEVNELSRMYKEKGLPTDQAYKVAETIVSNTDIALETMAREELGFAIENIANPYKSALFMGISFVVGAAVPLIPYCVITGHMALYATIFSSLAGFFVIGACRTVVTGKSPLRSGCEMFMIGFAAAAITYIIGNLISSLI